MQGLTDKLILRPKDVSALLGVSLAKAYELWKRDDFPGKRLSTRCYFVTTDSFIRWLQQREGVSYGKTTPSE